MLTQRTLWSFSAAIRFTISTGRRQAKTVVRLGYYEDETSEKSNWNFPAAHYLESWGDATTSDGTLVPIQPLIQPLFGGLTELEFLARIAGESQTNPYEIVRATFGRLGMKSWKKFLFNGFSGERRQAALPRKWFNGKAD